MTQSFPLTMIFFFKQRPTGHSPLGLSAPGAGKLTDSCAVFCFQGRKFQREGKNNQTSGFQIVPHMNPDYDSKRLQGLASFHFYEVKGLEGEIHKTSGRAVLQKRLGIQVHNNFNQEILHLPPT